MICGRCGGSGTVFRPKAGHSYREKFRTCARCGGSGLDGDRYRDRGNAVIELRAATVAPPRQPAFPDALPVFAAEGLDVPGAVPMERYWTLAHVVAAVGGFGSVSEARRNGWDRPIPAGVTEQVVGPRRRAVTVRIHNH